MEKLIYILARVYYTLFCIERKIFNHLTPCNEALLSKFNKLVVKYKKKNSILKNDDELFDNDTKIKTEILKDSQLNPLYGMASIRSGIVLSAIVFFYLFFILCTVYYFLFSNFLTCHKTVMKTLLYISLGGGYLLSELLLPEKKWMYYFVVFETQTTNRKLWHFLSILIAIFGFVLSGIGANYFYLLKHQ